jgi:hypothetical protein
MGGRERFRDLYLKVLRTTPETESDELLEADEEVSASFSAAATWSSNSLGGSASCNALGSNPTAHTTTERR